jgi:UDP-N-acetylmuramate--alanine ligase
MEICDSKTICGRRRSDLGSGVRVAGKRYHFIGAGGIGMSGLAKVLARNKAVVSGSDLIESPITDMLWAAGVGVRIGHKAENLDAVTDVVVISAAIKEDNPELKLARERGCKVYKYAEMLGKLMDCYEGIAVSGTHGKSTTSGWLTYCLSAAGLSPSYVIGAEVSQLGGSSGVGNGSLFVAEACEYDRSFLNLRPEIGVILNIERDHLDYYKDEQEIVDAFGEFARGIRPGGVLIANGSDSNVAKMIEALGADLSCETFGVDESCNYRARDIELEDGLYGFEVVHNGKSLGRMRAVLAGRHNVENALAVIAVLANVGLDGKRIAEVLGGFAGIERRMTLKGEFGGVTVVDDYAHHPTEIRASLAAVRERYQPDRVLCVFQPHQYSRTRILLDDFAESFKLADVAILPDIYFARDTETAKNEVNSQMLVDKIHASGTEAVFVDGFGRICEYLEKNVTRGDLVVTMGAGDIWKVADEYIQRIRRDS